MCFKDEDVPGWPDFCCATPSDVGVIQLLGLGEMHSGVAFTVQQARELLKFYGYDPEQTAQDVEEGRRAHVAAQEAAEAKYQKERLEHPRAHPHLEPPTKKPYDAEGTKQFLEWGTSRNIMRAVARDGLRVMALLSRYLEPGEDPVRLVARLLGEAGFDVFGIDGDWIDGDGNGKGSEEETEEDP